jgi:hypothetical protein
MIDEIITPDAVNARSETGNCLTRQFLQFFCISDLIVLRGSLALGVEKDDSCRDYFGAVMFLTRWFFPRARLQGALDADESSLAQVLVALLSCFAEGDYAVPFRRSLCRIVAGAKLIGREAKIRYARASGGNAIFRILPESSDENDFVDATHVVSFPHYLLFGQAFGLVGIAYDLSIYLTAQRLLEPKKLRR